MKRLIQLELFKLKHSKGFRVLLLLMAVLGIFGVVASGATAESASPSGYSAYFKQFSDMKSLVFVWIGLFSGFFIGEDFSNRTLQAEIAAGYSRFSILASKALIMIVGVWSMIAAELMVVTLGSSLLYGFGQAVTPDVVAGMLRAYFMFAFLMSGAAMICTVTALWIKNKGTILAVNVFLLLALDGMLRFVSLQSELGAAFYQNTLFDQVVQSTAPLLSSLELMKGILTGFFALVVFFFIALTYFRKSELQ